MGALKWILEFVDRISGPAKKIVQSVKGVTVGVDAARKMFHDAGSDIDAFKAKLKAMGVSAMDAKLLVQKMNQELKASRRAAMGFGDKGMWSRMFSAYNIWRTSHAMNVASKTYGAVSTGLSFAAGVGERAWDMGKGFSEMVLGSAQFRENTLTALEQFLGTKAAALDMFRKAQQFALQTPMDTDEVVEGFKTLLSARIASKDVESVFASAGDIFAKFGKTAYESYMHGIVKMQSLGKLNQDTLTEMASGAKLDLTTVYAELGKMANLKGKPQEVKDKVMKMLGKGKFDNSAGLYAVMQAATGGKAPGQYAMSMTNTLTGTISNFKSAFGDLLQSVDLSNWPGIQALKSFLGRVSDMMKPGTESGKQLLAAVQKVTDAIFGGLANITDLDIAHFLDTISLAAESVAKGLKEAWEWMEKLLRTGNVGGAVEEAVLAVAKIIGRGIWMGVTSEIWGDAKPLDITEGLTARDKITYPWQSEFWEWKPGQGAPSAPSLPPGFRADRDAGVRRQQATVNITVHAGEGSDGSSIAGAIKGPVRDGVMSAFEQTAAEHGVGM